MRASLVLIELLASAANAGCKRTAQAEPTAHLQTTAPSTLTPLLVPRAAGRFTCEAGKCLQEQPRLPDTGEWRCADRGHVVWCAGGEPAAGVVKGPPTPGYRCGVRWGSTAGERVCIDEHPDYPEGQPENLRCGFEQELGSVRVCQLGEPWRGPALGPGALPACWLDRDCPSGMCDRGACSCQSDAACQLGRCQAGVCAEAKP
jgi:hypothetical protein